MIKTSLIFICFDSIQIFREINSMSFQVSLGHHFLTEVKQFLHFCIFLIRSFEFFRHGFLSMKDSLKCIVTLECDLRAQIQIIFFIGFLMAKCLVVWLLVWLNSWLLSLYYTKFFSINQWHLINNHSCLSAKYVIKGLALHCMIIEWKFTSFVLLVNMDTHPLVRVEHVDQSKLANRFVQKNWLNLVNF